ncbi:hypothetical protein MICAI_30001 [Microcystis sp. T1-4]|nr:hypothetical protein MICAI_30001 [Microcystis sp. T1-4]
MVRLSFLLLRELQIWQSLSQSLEIAHCRQVFGLNLNNKTYKIAVRCVFNYRDRPRFRW